MTKHTMYLAAALAALLLASPGVALTQSAGVLQVRVVSAKGKPVWGAAVSVRGDSGRYWDGTHGTGEDGNHSRRLRPGTYELRVRASGYRTWIDSFTVLGADTLSREVILTSNRLTEIGGMHVGGPGSFAVSVGHAYQIQPRLGRRSSIDQSGLLFFVVEPGLKAGRISTGYHRGLGNLGTGFSVRGTVLQRWSPTNNLYGGVELGAMIFGMGPRVGVFKPLRGDYPRKPVVFVDFSIGV